MTTTLVALSAMRASSPALTEAPPIVSVTSRPPVPIMWVTPMPILARIDETSWAPVPEAATMPTGPRGR